MKNFFLIIMSVFLQISFAETCIICTIDGLKDNEIQHLKKSAEKGAAYYIVDVDPNKLEKSNIDETQVVDVFNDFIKIQGDFFKKHPEINGFMSVDFIIIPSNGGKLFRGKDEDLNRNIFDDLKCKDKNNLICSSSVVMYKDFFGNINQDEFNKILEKRTNEEKGELSPIFILNKDYKDPIIFHLMIRINKELRMPSKLIGKLKDETSHHEENTEKNIY